MGFPPVDIRQPAPQVPVDDEFRPITLESRPLLGGKDGIVIGGKPIPDIKFDLANVRNTGTGKDLRVSSIAGCTRDGSLIFAATCFINGRSETVVGAFGPDRAPIAVTNEHRAILGKYVPEASKPFAIGAKGTAIGLKTTDSNPGGAAYYDLKGKSFIFDLDASTSLGSTKLSTKSNLTLDKDFNFASGTLGLEARNGPIRVNGSWNRSKGGNDVRQLDIEATIRPRMTVTASWLPDNKATPVKYDAFKAPEFKDPSNFKLTFKWTF